MWSPGAGGLGPQRPNIETSFAFERKVTAQGEFKRVRDPGRGPERFEEDAARTGRKTGRVFTVNRRGRGRSQGPWPPKSVLRE
jgi:hypothetical protein